MTSAGDAQLERLAEPAYERLWSRCRAVLERGGDVGTSSVSLRAPSEAERRALTALLGRHRPAGATLHVRLAELDARLSAGPAGLDLQGVLEALGRPLRDRATGRRAVADAIEATLERAAASPLAGEPWMVGWLDGMVADGTLTRLHGTGQLGVVGDAVAVLERLPAAQVPLPVLASMVTGDTKALTTGPLAGLVLRALATRYGKERPAGAAARRALWEHAGVVADDLASQVLVLNLPVTGGGRLGEWLAGAAADGTPFRVTLHQLGAAALEVTPGPVFVCENPAVLRAASAALGPRSRPLLCTEGRPSVAFARLADELMAGGCALSYHGDFDWPGVAMVSAAVERHGAAPWRMGEADYRAALRRVDADDTGVALGGRPVATPWDPALAGAMATAGRVIYEEVVLDDLLADLS